jgi:starch synthase
MLQTEMQFVLLGSGNPEYERAFHKLAARYPDRVAVRIGFDQSLSHRIEAGCDFYIMPSRFEPCGLNQMYSQRYGTIPIVRVVGGLDDSVIDATQDPGKATGIKFTEYSARALSKGIRKALILYQHPEVLTAYRIRAMTEDFSWDKTVTEYRRVYQLARKPA